MQAMARRCMRRDARRPMGAGNAARRPLEMRELRHHTKNALQGMLIQLHDQADAARNAAARHAIEELERRIMLSVAISDALFGMTREPPPITERLRALCDGMVGLLATQEQQIALDIRVEGVCPPALEMPVLRIAHEFVGNAVKHGMRLRLIGRIGVTVQEDGRGRVALTVTDDGWGPCRGRAMVGQGLGLARELAAAHGGEAVIIRDALTVARATLQVQRHV